MIITKILTAIALAFDSVALAFVLFAGVALIVQFFKSPKEKKAFALTDKTYHHLRKHFVHRVIIALDLFIAADLIKLAFISTTEVLIQLLLIVVIRTILSFFLMKNS